jgi:hypothetical protein
MKKRIIFVGFRSLVVLDPKIAEYMKLRYKIKSFKNDCSYDNPNLWASVINSSKKENLIDEKSVYDDLKRNFFQVFDDPKDFSFFENSIEAMAKLSEHYDLYVLASEDKFWRSSIENILRSGGVYNSLSGLYCTLKYDCVKNQLECSPKSHFIENVKSGIHIGAIDSSPKELKSMGTVMNPVLFNPYLKAKKNCGFNVARDWYDILDLFLIQKKDWLPTH